MSTFDANEYFNKARQLQAAPLRTRPDSELSPKELDVALANREKIDTLRALATRRKHNETNSLAAKVGLDPFGGVGGAVNTVASSVNDVVRFGSNALQAPLDAYALSLEVSAGEEARNAYQAHIRGIATEEETALLNTRKASAPNGPGPQVSTSSGASNLELLESAAKASSRAKYLEDNLNFDSLNPLDMKTGNRESGLPSRVVGDTAIALVKGAVAVPEMAVGLANIASLGRAGKAVEDAGVGFKEAKEFLDLYLTPEQQAADAEVINAKGFMNTLQAIANNPSTVKQFLAESLPSMGAGGVIGKGLMATGQALGRGVALVNQGVSGAAGATASGVTSAVLPRTTEFAAKWGSSLAAGTGEGLVMAGSNAEGIRQQTKDGYLTGGQAGLALLTAPIGAAVGVGGSRLAARLGGQDVDQALVEGAIRKNVKGALTTATISGAVEAGEETIQTAAETILSNLALDKSWDQGLGNAMAIGMATGAAMGAPMGFVNGAAAKGQSEQSNRETVAAAVKEATISGNVDSFIDPKHDLFNPTLAVSLLQANSLQEGKTEEQKAALYTQAEAIVASMDRTVDSDYTTINLNEPANRTVTKNLIKTLKEELKAARPSLLSAQIQEKEQEISNLESRLLSGKGIKQLKAAAAAKNEQVAEMQHVLAQWTHTTNAAGTPLGAHIEAASTVADPANTEQVASTQASVDHILTLAMNSPEQLSDATLMQLSSGTDNALTTSQRGVLSSALKARDSVRVAKSMGTVTSEVLNGNGEENVGINQYDRYIRTAIASGDEQSAVSNLADLTKFARGHKAKSTLMNKLSVAFKNNGVVGQMLPGPKGSGTWVQPSKTMTNEAVLDAGGYVIKADSFKLANTVSAESRAASDVATAARQAIALKFGNDPLAFKSNAKTVAELQAAVPGEGVDVDTIKELIATLASGTKVSEGEQLVLKNTLEAADYSRLAELYRENKAPATEAPAKEKAADTEAVAADKKAKWDKEFKRQVDEMKGKIKNGLKKPETLAKALAKEIRILADKTDEDYRSVHETNKALLEAERARRAAVAAAALVETPAVTPAEVEVEAQPQPTTVSKAEPTETGSKTASAQETSQEEAKRDPNVIALMKVLNRVGELQAQIRNGDGRSVDDLGDARKEVKRLRALVPSELDPAVEELFNLILDSDVPVKPQKIAAWVKKHGGAVYAPLFRKMMQHDMGKAAGFIFNAEPRDATVKDRDYASGVYLSAEHLVGINPFSFLTLDGHTAYTPEIMAGTLVHEAAHALTYKLINEDPAFKAKIVAFQERLKKWAENEDVSVQLSEYQKYSIDYATKDVQELLSTILGDTHLMGLLDKVTFPDGQTALSEFITAVVEALRKALNLTKTETTALTEVMHLFAEVLGEVAPVAAKTKSTVDTQDEFAGVQFDGESVPSVGFLDDYTDLVPPTWETEEDTGTTVTRPGTNGTAAASVDDTFGELFDEVDAGLVADQGTRAVEGNALDGDAPTDPLVSPHLDKVEGVLELSEEVNAAAPSKYQGMNLLARFFKQEAVREGSTTPRPLVAVKDFMQGIIAGTYQYQEFLSEVLRGDQMPLLNLFTATVPKWQAYVNAMLLQEVDKEGNPTSDFHFLNTLQFLIKTEEGKPVLDDNASVGFIAAAFSWLIEEGGSPELDINEAINKKSGIPGRSPSAPVSLELSKMLGRAGGRRTLVANSIGQRYMQAMGWKVNGKDVPISLRTQVEANFGMFILGMLESMGMTEEVTLTQQEIMEAAGLSEAVIAGIYQGDPSLVGQQTVYVKVRRADTKGLDKTDTAGLKKAVEASKSDAVKEVAHIVTLAGGTNGVFDKLMNTDERSREPSLRPLKYNPRDTEQDRQKSPNKTTAWLDKVAKLKYTLYQPTLSVLRKIGGGSTALLERFSGVKEVTLENTHRAMRGSQQAKFDNLRREITDFQDFLKFLNTQDLGAETPFYLMPTFWKNQRFSYGSKINGQTSKIHRWMIMVGKGVSVVSLLPENHEGSMATLDNFKLRVMEALDQGTDKQMDAVTLKDDAFGKLVGQPEYVAGIAAIQKMVFGVKVAGSEDANGVAQYTDYTPTVADQQALEVAVAKTGTLMHGFAGLMALAHWQQALDNGDTTFNTSLTAEIDGKTNGPMLSMFLLGVMDAKTAEMGGFYSTSSTASSFGQWKPGNHDLYQRTAAHLNMNLNLQMAEKGANAATYAALFNITGQLKEDSGDVSKAGRQVVKDAINPLVYGSGIDKAISGMADAYIESVYKHMAALSTGSSYGTQKLTGDAGYAALVADLNTLMDAQNNQKVTWKVSTLKAAMETLLRGDQEKALRAAFDNTVGKAMEAVIKEDLGEYIEARRIVVAGANTSFGMYKVVFERLYAKTMNELMASGDIPFTEHTFTLKDGTKEKRKVPLHDLTQEQAETIVARLKELEPRMHTVMSSIDRNAEVEDALDRGIFLGDEAKELSNELAYSGRIKVPKGIPLPGKPGQFLEAKGARGFKVELAPPGVSVMSNSVQSTDAAVIIPHVAPFEAWGVHDAIIVAIKNASAAGRAMNKSTVEHLLNHSISRESLQSLERSYIALAAELKANPTDRRLLQAVLRLASTTRAGLLKSEKAAVPFYHSVFEFVLSRSNTEAYRSDMQRLLLVGELTVVDQYTLEAGTYAVPNTLNAKAKAMAAALQETPNAEAAEAAKYLSKVLKQEFFKMKDKNAAAVADEFAVTETPAEPQQAAKKKSTTAAVDTTPHTAIGSPNFAPDLALAEKFAAGELNTASKLIQELKTRAFNDKRPGNISKFYLALLSQAFKVLPKDMPIRYLQQGDKTIEIPDGMETAFGWYTVNMDTGKGEIVIRGTDLGHSAVSMELAVHELLHAVVAQLVAKSPENIKEFVAEIQDMMAKTKAHLANDPVALVRFADALNDVQEFITWGMSNTDFQKVLQAQAYTSAIAGGNKLVNMAQRFFRELTKAIFGNTQHETQLSTLISHVSVLMQESALAQVDKNAPMTQAARVKSPLDVALDFDSVEMFDALQAEPGAITDPTFSRHLRSLLSDMVAQLQGPYRSLYEAAKADRALTPHDAWVKSRDTGRLPFRSTLLSAGFNLGEQAAFATEMVQMVIIESIADMTTQAERALSSLVTEAGKKIKPSDLNADPVLAQQQWDLLFKPKVGDVQGHWRANFVALALTHKPLADLLNFNTADNVEVAPTTLYGKTLNWFIKLLNWLNSGMGKAFGGQNANDKLRVIADRMVDLQAKRALRLHKSGIPDLKDKSEAYLNGVSEKVRAKLTAIGDGDFLQKSDSVLLNVSGTVLATIADQRVTEVMEVMEDLYYRNTSGRLGFASKLYEEVRGTTEHNRWGRVMLMLAKLNEKLRHDINANTSQAVLESFDDSGKYIDRESSFALTKTLLHTGSAVLLKDYSMTRMQELLSDPVELQKEITNRINQFTGKHAEYYKNQSLLLGYYLATGLVKGANLRMNAKGIALLDGTHLASTVMTEQAVAEATEIIDALASLQALKYVPTETKDLVVAVMAREAARPEGNGIAFTLGLHKVLLDQARERVFSGSDTLMMKGYVPQILNPHIDMVVAPEDQIAAMEKQGYTHEGPVQRDSADVPGEKLHMFSIEKGLQPRISGTFSTKGMSATGSTVHGGLTHAGTNTLHQGNARVTAAIGARKRNDIAALFKAQPTLDPTTDFRQYLAPVSNEFGETVNYRYIMGNAGKDGLFERNNSFDAVLGTLAANTYDKETTKTHNKKVVADLYAQWQGQKIKHAKAYMLVSAKSNDPDVVAAYRLLPRQTRDEIKAVWGDDGMMVRRDMYDLHFGFRKFSIMDMFDKKLADRGDVERVLVKFFEDFLGMGPRAGQRLRKIEDIWQFIVGETKDFIVVKSGVTLFWNVISNFSMLMVYGVGIGDIARHHRTAYKGITAWKKDSAELHKLELQRESQYIIGSAQELDDRITVLKEQMARNPVRGLVEAGLDPAITEDVSTTEDLYSYKSKQAKALAKYTDRIYSPVKTVAKWLYVSHDTPLYKLLSHGTQTSDFLAKFTLYQHMTARNNEPLTHEAAVELSNSAFVNYDLPSHKGMQYLNDTGLVMFTKYYLRIQHAILHMYQNNPGRGIMMLTLDNYFDGVQTIVDSSFMNHLGWPFTLGPLNFPGAVMEGMPAWMLGKLFR
jgi:hypothetical protein